MRLRFICYSIAPALVRSPTHARTAKKNDFRDGLVIVSREEEICL